MVGEQWQLSLGVFSATSARAGTTVGVPHGLVQNLWLVSLADKDLFGCHSKLQRGAIYGGLSRSHCCAVSMLRRRC
jgi:hypothetical protein